MKDFKIWCKTDEERDKVLAKMENEGILWLSGDKPTEMKYNTPLYLMVHENIIGKFVSVDTFKQKELKELTVEEYLGGKTQMTKADLKTGYLVTTRNGKQYVVYLGAETSYFSGDCIVDGNKEANWLKLDNYNEDLTFKSGKHHDIMKVEKQYHPYDLLTINYCEKDRKLLWEREEVKEMTMSEIEKLVGCKVKIINQKI